MRVLAAVVIAPHMSASGAVNAAKQLSEALSAHCKIDVALMSSRTHSSLMGSAQLLERTSSNLFDFTRGILPDKFRTLLYRSDIPNLVLRSDYDLVHIHNPIPALEMKRIAKACVAREIPYIVSTHGFVEVTSGGRAYSLHRFYERLAWKFLIERPLGYVVRNARMFFALSPLEKPLLASLGVGPDRIRLVTNGVNQAFYIRAPADSLDAVALRFGLPRVQEKQAPVCIYLGNHTRNKGVDVLLEAFTRTEMPFTLILCGRKRDTIDYDGYIMRTADKQRIVATDSLSDQDVVRLLQYSDIFVYPTLSDTLPLVVLEAMACGLPVISTNVGGIPYQVGPSSGILVQPGDPEALRDAFEHLARDGEARRAMGQAARESVESRFDWNRSAAKAFSHYMEITRQSC